ncbi:hypothetical protein, partial [Parabacteroides goldsteinii]|uniref:hypothetical protein n=1 Tax=Parabacteroides goldsteinii TaxID=328812 RepID=UPI0025A22A8B
KSTFRRIYPDNSLNGEIRNRGDTNKKGLQFLVSLSVARPGIEPPIKKKTKEIKRLTICYL